MHPWTIIWVNIGYVSSVMLIGQWKIKIQKTKKWVITVGGYERMNDKKHILFRIY